MKLHVYETHVTTILPIWLHILSMCIACEESFLAISKKLAHIYHKSRNGLTLCHYYGGSCNRELLSFISGVNSEIDFPSFRLLWCMHGSYNTEISATDIIILFVVLNFRLFMTHFAFSKYKIWKLYNRIICHISSLTLWPYIKSIKLATIPVLLLYKNSNTLMTCCHLFIYAQVSLPYLTTNA